MTDEQKPGSDFAEIQKWITQIDAAKKRDKDWISESNGYYDRYANEKAKSADDQVVTEVGEGAYNLLFSNTQILQPTIYSSTPAPDVRRRYKDEDEVGELAAKCVERGLEYEISDYAFDDEIDDAVFDMLICGRGAARVKYSPTFSTTTITASDGTEQKFDKVDSESTICEWVAWDKYRFLGNARRWSELTAMCFDHRMTRDELVEKFGEKGNKVTLDDFSDEEKKTLPENTDIEKLKTAAVFEIWDMDEMDVKFFSPGYKEQYLAKVPDPLKLKGFWPMPRPIYFVKNTKSLVPVPLTRLYKRQLRELDLITVRMAKVVDAMRVRGLYPAQVTELARVAQGDDNDWIPIENAAAVADGDLNRLIWTWPIEKLPLVLQQLVIARNEIKNAIYEIIGISDILRGASKASETLGAQKIKATSGSIRISNAQKEVARFTRDILRMKAEIMVDRYDEQKWAAITNLQLSPTGTKQRAQMVLSQLPPGAPPPPLVQEALTTPEWGDVLKILKDDQLRSYTIDIETDSTIADQIQHDAADMAATLTAIGQVLQGAVPGLQMGVLTPDIVTEILLSICRASKWGSNVEDAIEDNRNKMRVPPQGAPQPGSAPNTGAPQPPAAPGGPPAAPQAPPGQTAPPAAPPQPMM